MASSTADFAVIGGGVIGLALARELSIRNPKADIVVFEKEGDVGLHASGRNSGVLHAGFYYAPDSLKARLTRQGNELLREFCRENGVPVRSCGKVVVARAEEQLPRLDELARRGEANGVPLDIVSAAELGRLEPLARTHDRAIWSPTTGVADPALLIQALRSDAESRGISVRTSSPVVGASPGRVYLTDGSFSVGHVVNAAGLYADKVANWFGFCDDYVMMPFKGLYWYGSWPAGRLTRHVYPVPDPRNPFLGVHFTVTADGKAKIGPTAIPVFWREQYEGFGGFDRDEMSSILRSYPRFLRSEHHDSPGLISSELPKYSRWYLVRQARALVPSANEREFRVKGRPGLRAQLLHLETGRLEMDFLVRGDEHSTHVLNAVSPAWTSSLAFASLVASGEALN